MKIQNHSRFGLLALLIVVALGGCAMDEERMESADFGDSVRHTIALQTEYPGSAGTGMDAQKAANVMQAYREDVAKPQAAERDIRFRVTE
jgi:hypothetical protein